MNLCVQTNPTRLPENWQIASVVLGLHDLATTIVAIRAHVVTQVHFAGGRLDSDRGRRQEIVLTMHAALGRRLLVLLNSHD